MARTGAPTRRQSRAAKNGRPASSASRGGRRSMSQGITRIDQDSTRTHGFVVRVDYRQTANGWRPKHTSFFGDVSHGGKTKALAAAEKWLSGLRKKGGATKRAAKSSRR